GSVVWQCQRGGRTHRGWRAGVPRAATESCHEKEPPRMLPGGRPPVVRGRGHAERGRHDDVGAGRGRRRGGARARARRPRACAAAASAHGSRPALVAAAMKGTIDMTHETVSAVLRQLLDEVAALATEFDANKPTTR